MAKTINGLYKTVVIRHRDTCAISTMWSLQPWNGSIGLTIARLLEPIGNILPVGFEMAYYRQLRESADVV